VTADNVIVVTPAGSECGNSSCSRRAADTKPRRQASRIIATASKLIDNVNASPA
jgi:hypothetical protein